VNGPTAYDGVYPRLIQQLGHAGALTPGLLLAYLGMGGLPLLTFLAGGALAWGRGRLQVFDLFPLALLVWAGALMLWAPAPFQVDFTEFRQRGFVIVVVALYCWNARWLALLLPPAVDVRLLALASCVGLVVPLVFVDNWKAPRMAWGKSFESTAVSTDMVAAAAWLRAHSGPATAFAMARPDPTASLLDDSTILMGLSGDSAWLSRPALNLAVGGARAAATRQREQILAQVARAPSEQAAFGPLRAARVDFFVVNGPDGPAWDPTHAQASFRAGDVSIYLTRIRSASPSERNPN
jgi:hypothetical protein